MREDLTGRTFHHFAVEGLAYVTNYQGYWWCRCACGRRVAVYSGNLKAGKSKSCGCVRDAMTRVRSRTHGHAPKGNPSAEYRTWQGINKRCHNPASKSYDDYGARGIVVDPKWRHDFVAFLADVGPRPSPNHSIERIDNEGPYAPGNVRWATKHEQARNTRRNHVIEHRGRRQTLQAWSDELGIDRLILLKRLRRGWSVHRAFTEPLMKNQFRHR